MSAVDIPILVDMEVEETEHSIEMELSEIISAPPYNWMGKNPKLISNFPVFSVALKDTAFNTWTPSTTAAEILATDNFGTVDVDTGSYDYIVKWTFWTELSYLQGATMKAMPIKQMDEGYQSTFRRSSNYTNFVNKVFNQNYSLTSLALVGAITYYGSTGALAQAYAANYGFYISMQAPVYASSTDEQTTMTIKRPSLQVRCSSTYMATARASEIDKNSKLYLKCEVFRVEKNAALQSMYYQLSDDFLTE